MFLMMSHWIVVGTHPLAWPLFMKGELVTGTCAKLAKVLQEDAQLNVEHLVIRDDQAVVILRLLATAKNGMRFDHRYCWIMTFSNKVISKVRSYLDSNMVKHSCLGRIQFLIAMKLKK